MMGNNKLMQFFSVLLFTITLMSCDVLDGFDTQAVEVDIPVEDVKAVLVMDGSIERNKTARLRLSYSRDIHEDPEKGFGVEENAFVSISTNDGQSENLVYKDNGLYVGNTLLGKEKTDYTMKVRIGNELYTATSTMFPEPGYDSATATYGSDAFKKEQSTGKGGSFYKEMWWVKDNPNTRDFYLFGWEINGVHIHVLDWAIDDNRVVHDRGYLRLLNPVISPGPNQFIRLTASLIDKPTYNFYNMYEKIMRNLVGTGGVTPYNPVSNFGKGTMGNFRAVSFSEIFLSTPPELIVRPNNGEVKLTWPGNEAFVKYYLYGDTKPGVSTKSKLLVEQAETVFHHRSLDNGKEYYYRILVEDSLGQFSPLSGEQAAAPVDSLFPPDDVKADTSVSDTSLLLSWESTPKAVKYHVYWATRIDIHKDSSYVTKIENGSDTTYTFVIPEGSRKGQDYYFSVSAENAESEESNLSSVVSNVEVEGDTNVDSDFKNIMVNK